LSVGAASEIDSLLEVSARIGAEPLLVQAATGNTSVKLDGVLWIKASGKWLADATRDDILIPVNLAETRRRIEHKADPAGQAAIVGGKTMGTSVETAMHAVLPHRVVLHVHSVNTIAWAVRRDGPSELAARLEGIDWAWIPYVSSGLPLAAAIQCAMARNPSTEVLVLANHGLVVCGEDCEAAENLLRVVERRVAIAPRLAPAPDWPLLARLSEGGRWQIPQRLPQNAAVHAMGTDPVTHGIVSHGVLYPCQAIFLTPRATTLPHAATPADLAGVAEPFVMVERAGVLVREKANPAESATLAGLAQVLQRIPADAPLEYLRDDQIGDLLCADVYHYRDMVEGNSMVHATSVTFQPVTKNQ